MAGTLFGIPLSQPVDINGTPFAGNFLYIYAAGTNTPASTFQDFGLTVSNPFPLQADASGRIPPFWVADGSYRARCTDVLGSVVIYDLDNIQAIGPSVASTGGGGGGGSVDANSVLQTGDVLWSPVDATRSGFIRCNALTFGSASSGATQRANADTQACFEFCWNNFSNTICPVTGGRGGNALSDWLSNKPIAALDMRGAGNFGLDTMGNSAAGRIVTATAAGALIGAEKYAIDPDSLPVTTFPFTLNAAAHSHGAGTFAVGTGITNGTAVARNLAVSFDNTVQGGGARTEVSNVTASSDTLSLASGAVAGTSAASGALAVSGTINSGGLGQNQATLSPGLVGTWYMKL